MFEEIYLNYKKNYIEVGSKLKVIEHYKYIENNHLLIISENAGKEFRWRIPFKSDYIYSEEDKALKVSDVFLLQEEIAPKIINWLNSRN